MSVTLKQTKAELIRAILDYSMPRGLGGGRSNQ